MKTFDSRKKARSSLSSLIKVRGILRAMYENLGMLFGTYTHSISVRIRTEFGILYEQVFKKTVKPSTVRPAARSKRGNGSCVRCSAPATVDAIFEVEGVEVLQKYCDVCLPNAEL